MVIGIAMLDFWIEFGLMLGARHWGWRGHVDDDGVVLLRVGLLPVRRELLGRVEARLALLATERLDLGRGRRAHRRVVVVVVFFAVAAVC